MVLGKSGCHSHVTPQDGLRSLVFVAISHDEIGKGCQARLSATRRLQPRSARTSSATKEQLPAAPFAEAKMEATWCGPPLTKAYAARPGGLCRNHRTQNSRKDPVPIFNRIIDHMQNRMRLGRFKYFSGV